MDNFLKMLQNAELKSIGEVWDVYYFDSTYIKVLNILDDEKYKYESILRTLENEKYQIKGLPKILEIFSSDEYFAYKVEEMKGIKLHSFMEQSQNYLLSFYQVSQTLIPILEEATKKEIVIKDLITRGNTLYDENKKRISVVDLDGMQVKNHTDSLIISDIIFSYLFDTVLYTSKYRDKNNSQLWTTELNAFLFYELFLNTVFHRSLLCTKRTTSIKDILAECGIPKESNLFGRIMDLSNLSSKNSMDIEDFKDLTKLQFDSSRKKIIN